MTLAELQARKNPKNANRHPAKQIQLLSRILLHAGWRAPITVSRRSGLITRGHGRLEAAQVAGLTLAPVDEQDYASEQDELADLIADNKIAELAEIDDDALKALTDDLERAGFDVALAGIVKEIESGADAGLSLPEKSVFEVVVECDSERHQQQVYERLQRDGLTCRVLTL